MSYCSQCGAVVDGQFCAKCGARAGAAPAGAGFDAPQTPPSPGAYSSSGSTTSASASGLTDNIAGLLCYAVGFITGILFLVLEPYNRKPFVRFHAFQSIFFSGAVILLEIAMNMVGSLFLSFSVLLLGVWAMLSTLVGVAVLVAWVMLLIKAYQGQRWKLPIIGDLAEKQANS